MKYIPNTLSALRLLLCLPLFILTPLSFWFIVIYVIAGLTDMIDGPLARRTNNTSNFGANLDAAADLLFAITVLVRVIPQIDIHHWNFVWIVVVIVIKFISLFVSYMRHNEFVMLHTYANKLVVFLCFLLLPLYVSMNININLLIAVLLVMVSLAFLEDLILCSTAKVPDRNVKGLFFR